MMHVRMILKTATYFDLYSYWQSASIYPALLLLRVSYSRIVYQIIQSFLSKPSLDLRIA